MEHDPLSDEEIREILSLNTIAVVGMSGDPLKAAHNVPKYLLDNGYDIMPVNPTADKILDRNCFDSVSEIENDVDIVDVFRPSDHVLPVVVDAIKKNVKVIWLQKGIHNPQAENLARQAGIKVVFNRCMLAEHRRVILTDFEKFYHDLLDLAKKYQDQNLPLKVEKDLEHEIVKIFGQKTTSLSRAKNGLGDVTELAYTAAEHHPLWSLIYNCSEIANTVLEKWGDTLSKDDISDIQWAIQKLNQGIEKIKDGKQFSSSDCGSVIP